MYAAMLMSVYFDINSLSCSMTKCPLRRSCAARKPLGGACQKDGHCGTDAECIISQEFGVITGTIDDHTFHNVTIPPLQAGTCSACSAAGDCQASEGSSASARLCSKAAGACVAGLLPGDPCAAGNECASGLCLPSGLCGEHGARPGEGEGRGRG